MFNEEDLKRAKQSAYKDDGSLSRDAQALALASGKQVRSTEVLPNGDKITKIKAKGFDFRQKVKEFIDDNPIYFDKNLIWWSWDKTDHMWKISDETECLNTFHNQKMNGGNLTIKKKAWLTEAMRQVGREYNPQPLAKEWIQFKDTLINFTTQQTQQSNPKYFTTNPIPWKLSDNEDTPIIDKLFNDWVGDHAQDLYEVLAYCCYTNYPIHVAICFVGCGRNGKSQFIRLLTKFLGQHNTTTSELRQFVENRFETFSLYKKLACIMGETNFDVMSDTALFKKMTTGDLVKYEAKHKNPFEDYSYCKLIIASNSLPSSKDTSEGFYRRWHIIEWKKEFAEGKDIIETIPEVEYQNLTRKVTRILAELIERGSFSHQGSISQRRNKYLDASNPLARFVEENCDVDVNYYVKYATVYTAYQQWLLQKKKRRVGFREFGMTLTEDGFEIDKTTLEGENARWIRGLRMKSHHEEGVGSAAQTLQETVSVALDLIRDHPDKECAWFDMVINPSVMSVLKRQCLVRTVDRKYVLEPK